MSSTAGMAKLAVSNTAMPAVKRRYFIAREQQVLASLSVPEAENPQISPPPDSIRERVKTSDTTPRTNSDAASKRKWPRPLSTPCADSPAARTNSEHESTAVLRSRSGEK